MKVLAVTNMYPVPETPTAGVFVEQQVEGLKRIGLQVEVVYFNRLKEGMGVYYRMEPILQEKLMTVRPDLIHVMYGGVMAWEITRRKRSLPVVVTFHGSDLLGENLSGWLRKAISHYGVWCSYRAAKRAQGIVAVSQVLERALPAAVDRSKLRIIPCGIDLDRFQPMDPVACRSKLGWSESSFHVLFPANAGDPVKQPELAKAALEALRRKGVEAEIHFLRGIPNQEVPIWINASHLLILTSRHEGSPTVVKEALACNVPVVSVRVGDVEERLEGLEGCHLADANPESLAAKMLLVKQGPSRVASRARMQRLSHESIARDLGAFYQQLVSSHAAGGGL